MRDEMKYEVYVRDTRKRFDVSQYSILADSAHDAALIGKERYTKDHGIPEQDARALACNFGGLNDA